MLFDLNRAIDHSLLIRNYGKFLNQDLLIDTAPLFLYLAGSFDSIKDQDYLIKMFNYSLKDYKLLEKLLYLFKKDPSNFIITPHTFHETIKHMQLDYEKIKCDKSYYYDDILPRLKEIIQPILIKTKYIEVKNNTIIKHERFLGKFDVGDISIEVIDKINEKCSVVITDDEKIRDLYSNEKDTNVLVIYFRDIINNADFFPK